MPVNFSWIIIQSQYKFFCIPTLIFPRPALLGWVRDCKEVTGWCKKIIYKMTLVNQRNVWFGTVIQQYNISILIHSPKFRIDILYKKRQNDPT